MKKTFTPITVLLCCLGFVLPPACWSAPAPDGSAQLHSHAQKTYIQDIEFTGNRHFSAARLKSVMQLKTSGILSWFTDRGEWKADLLDSDLDRLTAFYHNQGFLDAKVGPARIRRRGDGVDLRIAVVEGSRYRVAAVQISGNVLRAQPPLSARLQVKAGEVFRERQLRHDVETLTEFYQNRSYAEVQVQPWIKQDHRGHTVSLVYAIRPGQTVHIGRISISGNTRTDDSVIRRQLLLAEGDPYSAAKLQQSVKNLRQLDCLKDATIVPAPDNPPGIMNLQVRVEEKAPVKLMVSGGYSSDDGAFGSAQIVMPNAFGGGQYLGLRAYLAQEAQQYILSYTDPWLFGAAAGGGFDVYNWNRQYTDFTQDATGFRLRSSLAFGRWSTLDLYYTLENAKVSDVAPDASPILTDQEGRQIKSSISMALTRSTIDNILLPTRGSRNTLSVEYASPYLGSDSDFIKFDVGSGWYVPLWWKLVGYCHAEAGWIVQPDDDRPAPLYERFFLGGIDSLRAFDWASVGPKDSQGNVVGGVKYALTNVALLFPLVERLQLRGMVFFDAGNAYASGEPLDITKFRTDAGVGVVWNSPFGPLQIDWARNLDPQTGEANSKWQFSAGALF